MSERFSESEIRRYARHIVLQEIGGKGQEKLRQSKVLVVGAGGLGSPALLYLAAAGIGTLGIMDYDEVDLSNLQRQVIHFTPDVGRPKTDSAKEKLLDLNPGVTVNVHQEKLEAHNSEKVIEEYDVVVAALDSFEPRYYLNDACVSQGKPMVEAGVLRFDGMMMTIVPGKGPCYRCIFPDPPASSGIPSCAEVGVVGALPGTMGTLQVLEVIKIILDIGKPLVGRLLLFNALETSFELIDVKRDPECQACGHLDFQ